MKNVLYLENICKKFNQFELKGIDLELYQGEILVIIGPNGSGKSTLLNIISGLIKSDVGTIRIFDKRFEDLSISEYKKIGVLGEYFIAPEVLSVKKYLKLTSYLYNDWNTEKMNNLLARFQIDDKKIIKELSKGMKVKLGFIKVLLQNADIFLLDELFSEIDINSKKKIIQTIIDLKESGKTILIITHDLMDIESYCDKILILIKGKIFYYDSMKDILSKLYMIEFDSNVMNYSLLRIITEKVRNGKRILIVIEKYEDIINKIDCYKNPNVVISRMDFREIVLDIYKTNII